MSMGMVIVIAILAFVSSTYFFSAIFGIVTGFWKIANNRHPLYKTEVNDYSHYGFLFKVVYWPAIVTETYTIKIFG